MIENLVPYKGIVWYPFIRGLYIGLGGGGGFNISTSMIVHVLAVQKFNRKISTFL